MIWGVLSGWLWAFTARHYSAFSVTALPLLRTCERSPRPRLSFLLTDPSTSCRATCHDREGCLIQVGVICCSKSVVWGVCKTMMVVVEGNWVGNRFGPHNTIPVNNLFNNFPVSLWIVLVLYVGSIYKNNNNFNMKCALKGTPLDEHNSFCWVWGFWARLLGIALVGFLPCTEEYLSLGPRKGQRQTRQQRQACPREPNSLALCMPSDM